MSFMIDDITRAVELFSKKCASCCSTRSNTAWRRSVTAEKPDVIDQIIAEVIAHALDQEHAENRDRHHGPDVVNRCRNQIVEIHLVVEDGDGEQQHRRIRRRGFSTRSKIGPISSAVSACAAPTHVISRTESDR